MAFQKEKYKFLSMPLEEKRTFYRCRNYVTLDEVPTWQQLAKDEELNLPKGVQVKFPFDEELNKKVSIWEGDITTLEIDIVVNAANSSLFWGGGVCGAIFSAASGRLVDECDYLGSCSLGWAKLTGGYKLPAKFILHAVGPTNGDPDILVSCYKKCLHHLKLKEPMPELRSIAFPCIATGIFGFPNQKAAMIAVSIARNFLEANSDEVDRIIFCLFTPEDKKLYRKFMQIYFPLK